MSQQVNVVQDILAKGYVRRTTEIGQLTLSWDRFQNGFEIWYQLDWTPNVGVPSTWTTTVRMKSINQTEAILAGVDSVMLSMGVPEVVSEAAPQLKQLIGCSSKVG